MSDVPDPDRHRRDVTAAARDCAPGLEQFVRELMTWSDLLRHKALALRALAEPLRRAVADPLGRRWTLRAGGRAARVCPKLRSQPVERNPLRLAGLGAEDAIERARAMWDTVADPRDTRTPRASRTLAERLADQLEDRVNEALDEYEALGEELDRALARQPSEHPHRLDSAEASAHDDLDSHQTPGRNRMTICHRTSAQNTVQVLIERGLVTEEQVEKAQAAAAPPRRPAAS